MFYGFILGMDTFALGLIKAAQIIEDGRIDDFIKERYSSFNSGIGAKIINDETNLAELAEYAEKLGAPELPGSGRQEFLEGIINNILFG
jgi:xylose isomerase